jgi:outer membrane protein insertion porin family
MFMLSALCFAQDDYELKKISFEGNKTISSGNLKRHLSLKAKNFGHVLLFWKDAPTFNEYYLEEDIKQITLDYQKEGFLHVQVTSEKEINKKKKQVKLTFQITENQPVLVQAIDYDMATETENDKERIERLLAEKQEELALSKAQRFRDADVQKTKKQIYRFLQEFGYPFPEVDFAIHLQEDKTSAAVVYQITPGTYCDFGKVSVIGNEKTPTKVILKQATILENEMFTQKEIEKTQRNVQQLGMFQIVTMRNRLAEIEDNKIPIDIVVHELPYWSLKTGIGYGLEDRFRVSLTIKKLGFLGGARRANIFLKHSYLEPYHFSLKVTQPSFLNLKSSLSVNPFLRKEHEKAYDLQRFGIVTTLQYNLSAFSNTFINYKFERNNLEARQEDSELNSEFYNKSSVSWGISFDNSAPPFFPENGFNVSTVTTLSGLKLGSRYHYLQGLLDVRKYQSIVRGTVLAGRVKIGAMKPIWGDDVTPIEERFYAGGSNSVRGWARGEIGPQDEEDRPIGGNSYLEFSLELRQKIYKIFYLVAFADAGNIWQEYSGHDFGDLVYSGGLGIRIHTPIGPIRFDAAQPIMHSKKRIQLHISIGQAF